jgi:hypothetical protein
LIYQGLEEENLDQKSPGPPGWELMQRASSSRVTKKQEMLTKTNTKPRKVNSHLKFLIEVNNLVSLLCYFCHLLLSFIHFILIPRLS